MPTRLLLCFGLYSGNTGCKKYFGNKQIVYNRRIWIEVVFDACVVGDERAAGGLRKMRQSVAKVREMFVHKTEHSDSSKRKEFTFLPISTFYLYSLHI
jgi:hypothetical protein